MRANGHPPRVARTQPRPPPSSAPSCRTRPLAGPAIPAGAEHFAAPVDRTGGPGPHRGSGRRFTGAGAGGCAGASPAAHGPGHRAPYGPRGTPGDAGRHAPRGVAVDARGRSWTLAGGARRRSEALGGGRAEGGGGARRRPSAPVRAPPKWRSVALGRAHQLGAELLPDVAHEGPRRRGGAGVYTHRAVRVRPPVQVGRGGGGAIGHIPGQRGPKWQGGRAAAAPWQGWQGAGDGWGLDAHQLGAVEGGGGGSFEASRGGPVEGEELGGIAGSLPEPHAPATMDA